METKKSERVDLEKGKWTSLLIGFTMALAVMFVTLEWTQREVVDNSELYTVVDVTLNEELVPVTLPEKKTVPPPPAAVTKAEIIEIIDDDADIIEDMPASPDDNSNDWVDLTQIDIIEVEPEPVDDVPYTVVEDQPEFPGGAAALYEYLSKNIKYPAICRENNIQGRVVVVFIVNRDGSIVEPEVVKSVNPMLDKEALRVISNMPKWKPGLQFGKPVRVKFTVPVNFRLN